MEEIEVGDYVRTKYGEIGKLQKITIEPEVDIGIEIMPEVTAYWLNQHTYVEKKDIVKHSKNIIDLIELGDLVELFMEEDVEEDGIYEDTNIFEVIAITTDKKQIGIFGNDLEIEFVPVGNLRSILTQEQYDANCYRWEE